jgi:OFA family oxalate/formate antiporter-like MFS transporter
MNVSIQPSHIVKHRGLIALSALGIHICIGSVYAWSVYTKPIQDIIGWSLTEVTLSFSIAIFFLGLSAAVMGKFVERNDPRISALIATTLFCAGTVGSGLAISLESKYALYFFYGVLGGCGLGIGYISPVSTLVKWFPDRRGMATGIATFTILGSIYFIIMLTASLYLSPPPDDYIPPRYQQSLQSGQKNQARFIILHS